MKKFYISTNAADKRVFTSTIGVASQEINMDGDKIYYIESDKIDASQVVDQVSVFGTDAFNQMQFTIAVQASIIDALPISPVDGGWYLIAHDAAYNNIVTITLDGPIAGVIVGDNVVAENSVTGVVTAINTNDLTIKYNGSTAFSQGAGDSEIHEGIVFVSGTGTIQDITDEDKVGPFVSNIVSNPNALAYYSSTATSKWKILNPFNGLIIKWSANTYVWNNQGTSDKRWKLAPEEAGVGNSDLVTVVDLTAPGSTVSVDSSSYNGGVIQYTVANIDTTVVVKGEGSNDEVGWFNLNATNSNTTQIANDTYAMTFAKKYRYIKFTFVSETGGTAVTLEDISFFLTN